jgi:hypothetical protein
MPRIPRPTAMTLVLPLAALVVLAILALAATVY